MSKYIASIALLCAILVAAPAKADLSAFGFDPDQYDPVALLTFTFDGQQGSVSGLSGWNVILNNDGQELAFGAEGEYPMAQSVLTAGFADTAAAARYVGYYFGYTHGDLAEGTEGPGVYAYVGDMISADMEIMPGFTLGDLLGESALDWAPLGLALMIGPMAGLGLYQDWSDDGEETYLYLAELAELIATGQSASIGFVDLPAGFTFTLYGIVAKGDDGGVPEPATMAILGLGLAGLGIARRRMKK